MGSVYEDANGTPGRFYQLLNIVPGTVTDQLTQSQAYAAAALSTASDTITQLRDLSSSLELIDSSLTFTDIEVPDAGSFTTAAPAVPGIVWNLPSLTNVDEIRSVVLAKLISDIQSSSPAISPTVETAIFDRETERAVILHQATLDAIADEWSKRGFTLPNAFLLAVLSQAEIDYTNKRLDISRDIAIKNFELTDTNMKFAIQQGISFVASQIEVYKAEISAEISRIDGLIRTYLGEMQGYQTQAQVFAALADIDLKAFDSELRQELGHAELIIKNTDIAMRNYEQMNALKIEAVRAIGSINAQVVAGALSSVSVSTNMSASETSSFSYSISKEEY